MKGTQRKRWVVRTQKFRKETAELEPKAWRRGRWLAGTDVSEGKLLWLVLRV